MRGSAASRTGVAPGGALAGPWVSNPLWSAARALPSLDLRFAENKSLTDAASGQSLVTFTRASSGTYAGSDGVLQRATTNLLLRSEEFDNASWAAGAGGNASVTPNAIQSPVGTLTADLLDDTSAVAVLGKSQSIAITSSTRSYTASCYIKANSSSVASVRLSVGTGGTTVAGEVVVNLSTGAAQWRAGTVGTSFSVVSAGDNWYKVAVVVTDNASGNTLCIAEFRPAFATTYSDTLNNAAQGSAYFWGAQLEQSSTVGEYIPTTSTINSAPRFDHNPTTGESLGLLVEEQRTNSIRNNTMVGAVAGTPGTTPINWGISSSATGLTREIIGTGTESGITYLDVRYSGTSTSGGSLQISTDTTTGIPALTGQTWTGSSYVRLVGGSLPSSAAWTWLERDSGGVIVVSGSGGSVPITADSLNSQRRTTTRTLSGGATVANLSLRIDVTVPNATAVDVTLRIGLPQLEQGAFATSVIPTTGTAATRSADVASITGTNFSSWYRQDEGTVYADATVLSTSKANQTISFNDSTLNNRFELRLIGAADTYRTDCVAGGVTKFSNQNFASSGTRRIAALAVKANDFRLQSGASGISPASDAVPTVDRLYLNYATFAGGEINGTIRRLCYWGQRLPNSTLQAITQ